MAELVCRADDPQWPELRRTGVTATDLPAILGITRWDSLYACWWRKRGAFESQAENDRLMLGSVLEPYIRERWMDAAGQPLMDGTGLFRSSERAWQLATPDATVAGVDAAEPLECKSWGTTDGWGDDGSDLVPLPVRAQVLWQMDTLGAARGHVGCVFLPSGEFRSYVVGHKGPRLPLAGGYCADDCQACGDILAMRGAALAFWESVQAGESPSPDGSLASLAMLKARFAPVAGITAELPQALWNEWAGARWQEKHWERIRKDAEAAIREEMGDASIYALDGEPVIRRESFESNVKAHTRTVDRLMPVKPRKDDDNGNL